MGSDVQLYVALGATGGYLLVGGILALIIYYCLWPRGPDGRQIHELPGKVQLTRKTSLLIKRIPPKPMETCSICLTNNPNFLTSCEHYAHEHCIRLWMQRSSNCPKCRDRIAYE